MSLDSLSDVLVNAKIDGVVCDLMYAKDTNFTKRAIYKSNEDCFMHIDVFEKFELAVKIANYLGYKVKIADAFRPIEVQKLLWDAYPDDDFVSNPANIDFKLGHCRGTSLDVTLVDSITGIEVPMGTPVDSFDTKSHLKSTDIPKEELKNRMILMGIMTAAGFKTIDTEWWHFNLPDMLKYPIIQDGLKYVPILTD